jgi:uncharacterized protein (TIGR03066 family)
MKGILAACVAAIVLVGAGFAEDKKDEKKFDAAKLVGKWELTKTDDATGVPKGAIVEFTKDNKLNLMAEVGGQKLDISGTYKVDGDKLTVKMKGPDGSENEETDTITELTDTKLVLTDKDKKVTELTKKK